MTPNNLPSASSEKVRSAIARFELSSDAIVRVREYIERGVSTWAIPNMLVLPPGAPIEFIEPKANGIRIRHVGPVRGPGWGPGPRWIVTTASRHPERVRTCRGSRR